MNLPKLGEIEHADWPTLKRLCSDLGLNPKGRSAVVRLRLLDHVRRRTRSEPWKPTALHVAPLLVRLGFPEAAGRLWESTLRLDAPAPWMGLGVARLSAGDRAEALKAFDRAAQMGDASAHLHRALAFADAGDIPSAVRACDAYLVARPGDLRGAVVKASCLARGGWTDEAATILRELFESRPEAREAWRGIGRLLLQSGRADEAAQAFRESVRADPQDLDARINEGTAHLLAGRAREAIGAYRDALEADGTRADALNNLGVAYLRSGRAKSAIVNLERAAKHIESRQVLLNAAKAFEAERRTSEAVQTYRRLLRTRPKDAEALAALRGLETTPAKEAPPRARRVVKARRRAKPRRPPKARKPKKAPSRKKRPSTKRPPRRRRASASRRSRPRKKARSRR